MVIGTVERQRNVFCNQEEGSRPGKVLSSSYRSPHSSKKKFQLSEEDKAGKLVASPNSPSRKSPYRIKKKVDPEKGGVSGDVDKASKSPRRSPTRSPVKLNKFLMNDIAKENTTEEPKLEKRESKNKLERKDSKKKLERKNSKKLERKESKKKLERKESKKKIVDGGEATPKKKTKKILVKKIDGEDPDIVKILKDAGANLKSIELLEKKGFGSEMKAACTDNKATKEDTSQSRFHLVYPDVSSVFGGNEGKGKKDPAETIERITDLRSKLRRSLSHHSGEEKELLDRASEVVDDVRKRIERGDSFMSAKQLERQARLDRARERIEREKEAKARKAEQKKERLNENERIENAYRWYNWMGMPTRDKFIDMLPRTDLSEEDIHLLPWNKTGKFVNAAEIMRMQKMSMLDDSDSDSDSGIFSSSIKAL